MRSSLFSSSPNEVAARRAWPPGLNCVHSGRMAQSSLSILPKDHKTTSHEKPLTTSTWQRGVWRCWRRYVVGAVGRSQFAAALGADATALAAGRVGRTEAAGRPG